MHTVCSFCGNINCASCALHNMARMNISFLPQDQPRSGLQRFIMDRAFEQGDWSDLNNKEQVALALSKVRAENILPALTDLSHGTDLLGYHVKLREHLHDVIVQEVSHVLHESWRQTDWKQVGVNQYLCVIGAGVAVCMDTTPHEESLSLRYARELESEMYLTGTAPDRVRSRLGLQTNLNEKLDTLLATARSRIWYWVTGE